MEGAGRGDGFKEGVVPDGRSLARLMMLAVALAAGCGGGPRNFRKIESTAPLTRARAVGLGARKTDAKVLPALIERLSDPDPVVRLAANQELIRRTGRDFGYVSWASAEERSGAIARWRDWLGGGDVPLAAPQASMPRAVAKIPPPSATP